MDSVWVFLIDHKYKGLYKHPETLIKHYPDLKWIEVEEGLVWRAKYTYNGKIYELVNEPILRK